MKRRRTLDVFDNAPDDSMDDRMDDRMDLRLRQAVEEYATGNHGTPAKIAMSRIRERALKRRFEAR
jgi:hypothetical protein